jgi:hypothetical protein
MFNRYRISDVLEYEILFEPIAGIDDDNLIKICQAAFEKKKKHDVSLLGH